MPLSRFAASAACCFYAMLLLVAAIPSPQELRAAKALTGDSEAVFTSLDHAAVTAGLMGEWWYGLSEPLRAMTRPFVSLQTTVPTKRQASWRGERD